VLVRELTQWLPDLGDLVFSRHVQGAMEDLNAHLGRSDRFDRLSHHSGDGGFPLHPFLVLRGSVYSSYHNTIILP
jgi:hypothetical protein